MADKDMIIDGKGSRGDYAFEYIKKLLKQKPKTTKESGKSDKSDKKKGK